MCAWVCIHTHTLYYVFATGITKNGCNEMAQSATSFIKHCFKINTFTVTEYSLLCHISWQHQRLRLRLRSTVLPRRGRWVVAVMSVGGSLCLVPSKISGGGGTGETIAGICCSSC